MSASIPRDHAEVKRLVIAHYGSRCQWPGCSWTDPRALCLDHINGGGNADRRWSKMGSPRRWREVFKQGCPTTFQLLCLNHNHIKGLDEGEAYRAGQDSQEGGDNEPGAEVQICESIEIAPSAVTEVPPPQSSLVYDPHRPETWAAERPRPPREEVKPVPSFWARLRRTG